MPDAKQVVAGLDVGYTTRQAHLVQLVRVNLGNCQRVRRQRRRARDPEADKQ